MIIPLGFPLKLSEFTDVASISYSACSSKTSVRPDRPVLKVDKGLLVVAAVDC